MNGVSSACLFSPVSCHCPSHLLGSRHAGLFSNIPNVLCYCLRQAFTHSFLFLPLHLVNSSYLSSNLTSSRKPSLTSSVLPDILYSTYILCDRLCLSSPLDCKQHERKDHFDVSDHPILDTCLDPWHIINASWISLSEWVKAKSKESCSAVSHSDFFLKACSKEYFDEWRGTARIGSWTLLGNPAVREASNTAHYYRKVERPSISDQKGPTSWGWELSLSL